MFVGFPSFHARTLCGISPSRCESTHLIAEKQKKYKDVVGKLDGLFKVIFRTGQIQPRVSWNRGRGVAREARAIVLRPHPPSALSPWTIGLL